MVSIVAIRRPFNAIAIGAQDLHVIGIERELGIIADGADVVDVQQSGDIAAAFPALCAVVSEYLDRGTAEQFPSL